MVYKLFFNIGAIITALVGLIWIFISFFPTLSANFPAADLLAFPIALMVLSMGLDYFDSKKDSKQIKKETTDN